MTERPPQHELFLKGPSIPKEKEGTCPCVTASTPEIGLGS